MNAKILILKGKILMMNTRIGYKNTCHLSLLRNTRILIMNTRIPNYDEYDMRKYLINGEYWITNTEY